MTTTAIHVGLNKTATTWLQGNILPALTSHRLLGVRTSRQKTDLDHQVIATFRDLTRAPTFPAGSLASLLRQAAQSSDLPLLLSEEGLTATLLQRSQAELARTLDRLQEECPSATILFVFRRQADLIRSSHRQYVKQGGLHSFQQFASGAHLPGHRFEPAVFDSSATYAALVDRWRKPESRVVAVPYEMLLEDRMKFLEALLGEIGVDGAQLGIISSSLLEGRRNPSLSCTSATLMRGINRIVSRGPYNPRGLRLVDRRRPYRLVSAIDSRLPMRRSPIEQRALDRERVLMRELQALYTDGNRWLAERTGLDLARYAYW